MENTHKDSSEFYKGQGKFDSYYKDRLKLLEITEEDNKIDNRYITFSDDGSGNILIRYINPNGSLMEYKPVGSRYNTGYKRIRYAIPRNDKKTGKSIKYHSPPDTSSRPFLNGLVKFFPQGPIETLYMVEGEFKAFVLCKMGIPAIGISGIHCFSKLIRKKIDNSNNSFADERKGKVLDAQFLKEILQVIKLKGVKKLVFLHDADATENSKQSRLISFSSSVNYFNMACKNASVHAYYSHINSAFIEKGKGIDDLLTNYKTDSHTILNELKSLSCFKYFTCFDLKKTPIEQIEYYFICQAERIKADLTLKVRQYISDEAEQLTKYIVANKKIMLQATTGTGKTTFCLDKLIPFWVNTLNRRVIILQPLTVILDAIAKKKYGEIAVIKQGNRPEDIQIAINSKVVVCTYDSYSKIDNYTDDDLIIADEIHYLLEAYSMLDKQDKYEYCFIRLMNSQNVLFVSATPQATLKNYINKWVTVEAEKVNNIHIHGFIYTGQLQHYLARFIIESFNPAKGKVIVRLNDEQKSKEIAEGLNGYGNIGFINAASKDDPTGIYQHIVSHNRIPEEVNVLFATSVIDCGVDINNEDIQAVIVAECDYPVNETSTLQFIPRFRKVDSLSAYIFKKQRKVEPISIDYYNNSRSKIEGVVERFNKDDEEYRKIPKMAVTLSYNENSRFIGYDKKVGRYYVNDMALLHACNQDNTTYTPANLYFERLSTIRHIKIAWVKILPISSKDEAKEKDKSRKAEAKKLRHKIIELLQQDSKYTFIAAYYKIKNLELKKRIAQSGYNLGREICDDAALIYENNKELFESKATIKVLSLYLIVKDKGFEESCIPSILKQSSKKVTDILTKASVLYTIEAYHNLSDKRTKADAENILIIRTALMQKARKDGGIVPLTAIEITSIVKRTLEREGTINKALKLFSILFIYRVKVVKVEGKCIRMYYIDNQYTFESFMVIQCLSFNKESDNPVTGTSSNPNTSTVVMSTLTIIQP